MVNDPRNCWDFGYNKEISITSWPSQCLQITCIIGQHKGSGWRPVQGNIGLWWFQDAFLTFPEQGDCRMIIYFSIRYRNPPLQRTTTVTPSISPLCACGCTQWARTWVLGSRPRVLFFCIYLLPRVHLRCVKSIFRFLKRKVGFLNYWKQPKSHFSMGNRLVRRRLRRSKTLKLKLGFFTQYVLHRPQRVVRSARRFAPVNIFFRKDTLKNGFFPVFLGFPKQHYNGLIYQESSNILSF